MSDDNNSINDLLSQLQGSTDTSDSTVPREEFTLSKEKLEEFLLNNSGKLIKDSLGYIEDIGQFVTAAPDSRDVEALAKLVSSSAAAIETLNKIHIADQKNKSSMEIKQLDIESKKQLQQNQNEHKLLVNREELMRQLFDKAKVIEADIEIVDEN
tara:strand:+ start:820 stop:1284 length:465 start_codon:yes stop_codon:yes gene_type:complete